MIRKAFSGSSGKDLKIRPKQTAPVGPPAPTIPATAPGDTRFTYGTIPYVEPSAPCTKMLKIVNITTDAARLPISAKIKIHMPSRIKSAACTKIRPLIFSFPLALSLEYPPRPRAKRFMKPKILAMADADSIVNSKRFTKYDTAALFTVNSTPKQHAY